MIFKAITIISAIVIASMVTLAVLGFVKIKNGWRDIFN